MKKYVCIKPGHFSKLLRIYKGEKEEKHMRLYFKDKNSVSDFESIPQNEYNNSFRHSMLTFNDFFREVK